MLIGSVLIGFSGLRAVYQREGEFQPPEAVPWLEFAPHRTVMTLPSLHKNASWVAPPGVVLRACGWLI